MIQETEQQKKDLMEEEKRLRFRLALSAFALFLIFVVGLFWYATTPEQTVGLTLSFVAGLSMIFLPCTLPLAFVIVPLTMGRAPKRGLLMALFFSLGLMITLSFYGVFMAAAGKTFGLKSDVEVYAVLFGGIAAFIFGLSEVGLLKFRIPAYSGKFPDFIQRQKDYMKTFLLGLLLGNAGVGCPNPAFYVLLGYIATTADLFNGWILGFVHGLGRSVPLVFLAILGMLGVNALSGIIRHKEAVERAMGWALVIIGAYLLTFGIFGHDWFVGSGIHSAWEQFVVNVGGERFGETILKHEHRLVDVPGFIQYGNMFFLGLLALTFFIAFLATKPSRRTMIALAGIYGLILLLIGSSTGWTFKLGKNIHVQFREEGKMREHVRKDSFLYHEEGTAASGYEVNFTANPMPPVAGSPVNLAFSVFLKPGNIPVPYYALELDHERLMHVIGVRDDMEEFFHIHPRPTAENVFETEYVFEKPGRYKLWSEIKKDATEHVFGHSPIDVLGDGVRSEKKVDFGRNVIVGDYQVALRLGDSVPPAKEMELLFDVHTLNSWEVELEDYLGAPMHLVIVKDDWKQFLHVHPEEVVEHGHGGSLNIFSEALANGGDHDTSEGGHGVSFRVVFPETGLYKAFVQFRPKGSDLEEEEALTSAFWIEVKQGAPLFGESSVVVRPFTQRWWVYLFVSLVFIIVLSLAVQRFLRVKNE